MEDEPGQYQSQLHHFSQIKKITDLDYDIEECGKGYKSTVCMKHLSSGQTITVKSSVAENKSAAHEKAAKTAYSQIKNIERQMGVPDATSKDLLCT